MTKLKLVPMTRLHIDTVIGIEQVIYPFPWTPGNFADSIKAGYDALVVCAGATPLMDYKTHHKADHDNVIGYAVVMHILDEAHLLNISIASDHQGTGLGRRVLHMLLQRASAAGARGMYLEVRPSNLVAISLYDSENFVRVGIRRNYYPSFHRSREDAIVMRRVLSADESADGGR
ncbi:MAG: ribosomal protein S18-alanine N-acetyltransferase [Burkholderiaceae bacterium]